MKKAILVAIIGAMTFGVNAGDWGKAPVAVDKTPIEECYDIGGTISTGYMSDYFFYGSRQAIDAVWTGVEYTVDSVVPITVGAWYINGKGVAANNPDFDELDLYASAALGTYAGFDVSIGYTHYFYPGNSSISYGEIGLDLTRSLGFVDLALESNYALTQVWYHQAGIEKTFGLTDSMSLVVGTGIGYADGYNGTGSSFSHYYASASLPIELNCRATLTPYIGYNGVPVSSGFNAVDLVEGGGVGSDVLHAGISLSVSF